MRACVCPSPTSQVRIPFFQMMTSLAAGEYGTSLVLRQFQEMGRTPPLEMLTWRKLVSTVIEYCGRYNQAIDEVRPCSERTHTHMF